jgi:DNA-binding transcriptional MerR regulator
MFKIGAFSKIALVSIKTLRYYDRVGLLTPSYTDEATGYRYYTLEQLPHLNKIMALKNLGLSLEQVAKMLDDNITHEEIRGMLRLKVAQIEQLLTEEKGRLFRVESCLRYIEHEGVTPDFETTIKSIPPEHALTIREPAPEMANWGTLIKETHAILRHVGIRETPRCLAVFHGNEYNHDLVDWELAFLTPKAFDAPVTLEDDRQLSPRQLPGYDEMVCTVHEGPYATLNQGYSALGKWVHANGYEINGAGREVYLKLGQAEGTEDPITELQFPVKKYVKQQ